MSRYVRDCVFLRTEYCNSLIFQKYANKHFCFENELVKIKEA